MSGKMRAPLEEEQAPRPGESFLSRMHRRKTQARMKAAADTEVVGGKAREVLVDSDEAAPPEDVELSDADMPALESLGADSDYSGFLSPKVSETLRRAALRKLFHGPEFNVIDGLDDYAEDFTSFETLGEIITSDMRHRLEVEVEKRAEAVKQALLDEEGAITDPDDGLEAGEFHNTGEQQSSRDAEQPDTESPKQDTETDTENQVTHARSR